MADLLSDLADKPAELADKVSKLADKPMNFGWQNLFDHHFGRNMLENYSKLAD